MGRKPKNVTGAELAVMSLLAEQPMHGYQIEQFIEERGMRDWTTIGFSSIYYILEKLRKIGWLESTFEFREGKGPARQIYSLTKTGKTIWKKAVLHALSHPNMYHSQFHLGLSNLPLLFKREILSALTDYTNALKEKSEELSVRLSNYEGNLPWHAEAMFNLSQQKIKTELVWVNTFMKKIEGRDIP